MSTKKDATKKPTTTVHKKKVATKLSTRREESTDRSDVKKTETALKSKSRQSETNLTEKKLSSSSSKNVIKPKIENPKVQSTSSEKLLSIVSTKKNVKPKVPVTPPSNRISKTQYFPSKNLYSNALKAEEPSQNNTASSNSSREMKDKVVHKNTSPKVRSNRDKNKDDSAKNNSFREMREQMRQKNIDKKILNKREKGKDAVKKISPQKIKSKLDNIEEREVSKVNSDYRIQTREQSPDSSSVSERPRTATLRKGSIVNANIVGPDVPKQLVPKAKIKEVLKIKSPSPKSEASDEYNYEDDFESYESDFEEDSSSSSNNLDDVSGEETSSISSSNNSTNIKLSKDTSENRIHSAGTDDERKMDSGHFDMAEYKHKQVLDNIKESIEKENANIKLHEVQRNNPASLSDEGFEEQKSLQFINFLDAKKKYEHRKSMEIKRRRGEEILNMIRLDTCSFTLFDLEPVTYEVFIKNYGNNNALQVGVQTGDDDIDEEIQTDDITSASKWTQFPVCFSKIDTEDPNYWQIYKSDYLGVGGDIDNENKVNYKSFNENSLVKFLLSAGNLILKIQAELNLENRGIIQKNNRDIPFSDGYILFDTNKNMVKDCSVKCVSFCSDSNKILTVHSHRSQISDSHKSVICLWNISNTEEPDVFFISYGDVSCCSFGLDSSDLIYAGCNDGTISVWDMKRKIYNEDSILKRTPLHTTDIRSAHLNKIVALHPLNSYTEKKSYFQDNQTNEICSLDEEGDIITWSVIMKHNFEETSVSNCTSWTDIVLVKNTRISLKLIHPELEELRCTDFVIDTSDANYVLVSTNYGFIIHYLIKGGRSNVKKFVPESASVANCLEICPFSPNYILAGFNDGNINLYSRLVEKPIMVLSNKEEHVEDSGIQMIQWSKSKPFVIYAKDINNSVHIWDLKESDIYPVYSVPFGKNITCMKLSPLVMDDNEKKSYLMIGTDDGKLYLHLLNKEYGPQPHQVYKDHVNTFLKYVNRL